MRDQSLLTNWVFANVQVEEVKYFLEEVAVNYFVEVEAFKEEVYYRVNYLHVAEQVLDLDHGCWFGFRVGNEEFHLTDYHD